MNQSMTGFGRGQNEQNGKKVTVDIKSVNGKFLDITVKCPRMYLPFEDYIKKTISSQISRGSVDVYISHETLTASEDISIDAKLAQKYQQIAKDLSTDLGMENDVKLSRLLSFPDVLVSKKQDVLDEEILSLLKPALDEASKNFVQNRQNEGVFIIKDLQKSVDEIKSHLLKVQNRAPEMIKVYSQKLRERIQEMLNDKSIDETRLLNEVAFFVDKADINEEIQRLSTHLVTFDNIIANPPSGKKLEFLSQEMTREANTMGSKANDIEITNHVLAMKNAIEKLKENLRNIE